MRLLILTSLCLGLAGFNPGLPAAVAAELPAGAAAEELPGDSLYHLEVGLVDQDGQTIPLSAFQGRPVIISMFYASCPMACPMLIADVSALEDRLTDAQRERVRVLLVSLDPDADTPAALREVIERHGLDPGRWRLASPPPERVRDIAALLGISYQAIEGGELHHSSIITLLDPQGRAVAQLDGLRQAPEPLLEALEEME
jgi:protein SCO1/2